MGGGQRYGYQGNAHRRVGQQGSLSRGKLSQTEWTLKQEYCQMVSNLLGTPTNDLFATADNHKLPVFCSRSAHQGILVPMGRSGRLCFPTIRTDPQDAAQTSTLAGATQLVPEEDLAHPTVGTPFQAASKDTISKWIITLILPHAMGQKVRAHDVRGQATSKALFAGVPLSDILKAAAWKTPTTFV